jgi:hypothetical protein
VPWRIGTYMRSCARSFVLVCLQQKNLPYPCIDKHAQTDPYQLAKRSVPAGSRSLILNMINPHHVDAIANLLHSRSARHHPSSTRRAKRSVSEPYTWPAPRPGRPAPAGSSGTATGRPRRRPSRHRHGPGRPPPRVMTRPPAARSVDRSAARGHSSLPAGARGWPVAPWMSLHTRAGAQVIPARARQRAMRACRR